MFETRCQTGRTKVVLPCQCLISRENSVIKSVGTRLTRFGATRNFPSLSRVWELLNVLGRTVQHLFYRNIWIAIVEEEILSFKYQQDGEQYDSSG